MDFIVLRLIHILSGAFWFGSVVVTFVFVQPVVLRVAPEGQRIMVHILRDRRFLDVVLAAALLTATAGAVLFFKDSGGFNPDFAFSASGIGFAAGGLAGLLALVLFVFVGYPTTNKILVIARQLEAEQRPPTTAEQESLVRCQSVLRPLGVVVPVLLTIALGAMATARYIPLLT